MKITIISDNTVYKPGLKSEWGFSCLVEAENTPRILFDTGAKADILLHNMEKLNIDPSTIKAVFISHNHWDHTGGLEGFLNINEKVKLYLPFSFTPKPRAKEVIEVKEPVSIYRNIFSTGLLQDIEQSLLVKTDKGVAVIAGCSHSGVGNILNSASTRGEPVAIIGGLHGFNDFGLVKGLDMICATHCTQHKEDIKKLYPKKYIEGGAGKLIQI